MDTSTRKRGRPPTYPWERWFSSGRFTLCKGVDFHHSSISMAQQVRQAASKRRLHIHLVESEMGLVVTVQGKKGMNRANRR